MPGFLDGGVRFDEGAVVVAHEAGGVHDEEGVVAAVDDERAEDEEVVDERVAVDAFEDVEAVDERRALNMFARLAKFHFDLWRFFCSSGEITRNYGFSLGSLRVLFISSPIIARTLYSAALDLGLCERYIASGCAISRVRGSSSTRMGKWEWSERSK